MAINGSLRFAHFKRGKQNCLPNIDAELIRAGRDFTVDKLKSELVKSACFTGYFADRNAAQLYVDNIKMTRYFGDLQHITLDELARFRLFEGGCGKRDYGACKKPNCVPCADAAKLGGEGPGAALRFWECPNKVQLPCSNCAPGTDAFTHTNAVINSAIKKLSKVTALAKESSMAPSGTLYRGLNGMAFPEKLLQIGAAEDLSAAESTDSCRGFVEFGFSSATPNKSVALEYSGAVACEGAGKCKGFNVEKGFCGSSVL